MNRGISQYQAQESQQILSNTEEKTLVWWVMHYTYTGSPITSSLLKELAELVHQQHIQHISKNKAIVKTIILISYK